MLFGGAFLVYKREEIYDRWQAAALVREMKMDKQREANAVHLQPGMQAPPSMGRLSSGEL